MPEMPVESLKTIGAEQLQRLLEISTTLSSTLDLKQLLDKVSMAVTALTDTEAASILLVDKAAGKLQFVTVSGMSASPAEIEVPLHGSVAGWIVQHGQHLILNDVQQDARHYTGVDSHTQYVTRNMLGVPLVTKNRVIGVLEAINKQNDQLYTQQDLALMQALASQAAVAIENARLFQQTDLIAEFMHELKTPLMALTTASEILLRQDETGYPVEMLTMIQRETARLSKLTQDFLELARLESGRATLIRQPVDLRALIDDVVALEEPQSARLGVDLETDPAGVDLPVTGDYDRLKQVLLNLVSNAIKYNRPGGRVVITVSQAGKEVVIAVTDTGPGIAPEDIEHLFERFYRVRDAEGFSEGAGLGLAIAKKIVEEHGGRIDVSSELGQGTVFRCYLPIGHR
jgi:signal transduction histidine kinase